MVHQRPALRLLLAAALLAAAAPSRADGTAPLGPVMDDLGRKAKAYATGTVTMDPGLVAKLSAFEKALRESTASVPPEDPRRMIADSVLLRSQLLRGRADNAPKPTEMKPPTTAAGIEKYWKDMGVELSSVLDAAKALQAPAATGPAPDIAGVARQTKEAEALALAEARTGAMMELAKRMAAGQTAPMDDSDFRFPGTQPAPLPTLQRGASEPRVGQAQTDLNLLRKKTGSDVIPVDDDYGRITAAAVLRFQRAYAKAYDLKPTGKLDAATETALRTEAADSRKRSLQFTLPGDENLGVETLQRRLNAAAGYRFLDPDGRYGPRTTDAVRAFQRTHKLKQTGEMNVETWDALIAADSPAARAGRANREPASLTPLGQTWAGKRIPADLAARVRAAADDRSLDPNLFQALVWAEGGRLGDRTSTIARGPSQITKPAADAECPDLGWKAVRGDDEANLKCGARILDRRSHQWLGDNPDPLVAASLYNTKEKHWKGIAAKNKVPPFRETVSYVTRISRIYCQITGVRLLEPQRHFGHVSAKLLALSKKVDREMDSELASEGQSPRPGCSPY